MANSVMHAVIGFMMQRGLRSMFSSGGSNSGGTMSAIANVLGGRGLVTTLSKTMIWLSTSSKHVESRTLSRPLSTHSKL